MWECVSELIDVTLDGQRIYLLCRCGNVSVNWLMSHWMGREYICCVDVGMCQ